MANNKFYKYFLLVIFLTVTSCAHQYSFNNKSYTSPNEALDAHKAYLQEIQNNIIPNSSVPKKKAIVITPSKNTCEALGITRKGSPTKDMIDYLGNFLEDDYAFFSNYLLKSNLFSSVDSAINDFPVQYANKVKKDYSATIYLDMKSPNQISWFIMVPPEYTPKQLHFDNMAENGAPKIQSWINGIHRNLREGENS